MYLQVVAAAAVVVPVLRLLEVPVLGQERLLQSLTLLDGVPASETIYIIYNPRIRIIMFLIHQIRREAQKNLGLVSLITGGQGGEILLHLFTLFRAYKCLSNR